MRVGERVVPLDALARSFESRRELVELGAGKAERRMCLPRGRERLFDADMDLLAVAEREPRAASRAKRLRLLELLEAEQLAEEATRLRLAARRGRDLDVV